MGVGVSFYSEEVAACPACSCCHVRSCVRRSRSGRCGWVARSRSRRSWRVEGPSGLGMGGPAVLAAPHVLPVEAKLDGGWRSEATERAYTY